MKKFWVYVDVVRISSYERQFEAPDAATARKLADEALNDGVEDWQEFDTNTSDMRIGSVHEVGT